MAKQWSPELERKFIEDIKSVDSHGQELTTEEMAVRGQLIGTILIKAKALFGVKGMIAVFNTAAEELGHTPNPLPLKIIKILTDNGFKIKKVHGGVKNAESVE